MTEENWNSLIVLALLFTITGDLIALFAELKDQRQASNQDQSEETTKQELRDLHNEIKLLKIQIENIKKSS